MGRLQKLLNEKSNNLCKLLCFCHAPSFPGMFSWSGSPLCVPRIWWWCRGREKPCCCVLSCQGGREKSVVGCCAGSQGELVKGRSEDEEDADCPASGKGHLREALLLHEEALRVNRLMRKNCDKNKNSDHSIPAIALTSLLFRF